MQRLSSHRLAVRLSSVRQLVDKLAKTQCASLTGRIMVDLIARELDVLRHGLDADGSAPRSAADGRAVKVRTESALLVQYSKELRAHAASLRERSDEITRQAHRARERFKKRLTDGGGRLGAD